jgi:hypothetical protein
MVFFSRPCVFDQFGRNGRKPGGGESKTRGFDELTPVDTFFTI